MNKIYYANSVAATGLFIKGLLPDSMLFEGLIKHSPYDMIKVRSRAEGVFWVLKSKEKLNKKMAIIVVNPTPPVRMQNKKAILKATTSKARQEAKNW